MTFTEQEQNLIDKKLRNQLDGEELDLFNEKMKNTIFKAEYTASSLFYQAIDQHETSRLKSRLQNVENTHHSSTSGGLRRSTFLILLLLLIAAIATYFAYNNLSKDETPQELFASYYEVASNDIYPVTRGGNKNNIKEGFYQYDNQNYEKAIEAFSLVKIENPAPSIIYFTGQSQLALKDLVSAKNTFLELTSIENDYKEQALWYLAMIHLQEDNPTEARTTLQQLHTESDFKKEQVEKLLEKLPLNN